MEEMGKYGRRLLLFGAESLMIIKVSLCRPADGVLIGPGPPAVRPAGPDRGSGRPRAEKEEQDLRIVIVGGGKVGFTLAEQLVKEKHDITIIDQHEGALRRAADTMDVMVIRANGVSAAALREAGADSADLLVAATGSDEVNMVCCLTAKNMGAKYTIARIRNPEYTSGLEDLKRDMAIDMTINPEYATAVEISRLLRFPSAANIETFCRGRVELMGFRLQGGDFLVDKPLYAQSIQLKKLSLLFCAVDRDGEVTIPNGSFVPKVGDKLYMIGQPASLNQFFVMLGRFAPKIKHVFIIGGGKISLYLAEVLDRMKFSVKVLERDEDRCRFLSEHLPRAMVICGDGTNEKLLLQEGLDASDAFVALTDRDEENLITSLYALQQGVSKVVVKSNRQNYAGIARAVGLDSVITPKLITAAHILQVVRGMNNSQGSVMNALYRIADGSAEAMEFTVSPATRNLKVPLREMKLKKGILLAVIVRGAETIIPEGSSYLQAGDSVIIISRGSEVMDLNDIFLTEETGAAGTGER